MDTPELWITLLKSIGMLSLVLGLLIASLYLIRKLLYGQSGTSARGTIQMLATYHISPKERIILVDVLGEKILLGVTPQNIHRLATLSVKKDVELICQNDSGGFSNLIKDALGKRFRNS
jgi:flagellar protein FliO/FliZ